MVAGARGGLRDGAAVHMLGALRMNWTNTNPMPTEEILSRVKSVIRRCLKLDGEAPIDDGMALAGGEYELDSLDILLIVTEMEKEFGIKINESGMDRKAFASVESLGAFVERVLREG